MIGVLDKNDTFLDYNIGNLLKYEKSAFFSKGLTYEFGQNFKVLSSSSLEEKKRPEIIIIDVLDKKRSPS